MRQDATLVEVARFLIRMHSQGVRLWPSGTSLRVTAPKESITAEDLASIQRLQPALHKVIKLAVIWYGLKGPDDFTADVSETEITTPQWGR